MNNNNTSAATDFVGMLTIAFIVLKLLDKIDWSWWWVLSPVWIVAGMAFLIATFGAIGEVIQNRKGD